MVTQNVNNLTRRYLFLEWKKMDRTEVAKTAKRCRSPAEKCVGSNTDGKVSSYVPYNASSVPLNVSSGPLNASSLSNAQKATNNSMFNRTSVPLYTVPTTSRYFSTSVPQFKPRTLNSAKDHASSMKVDTESHPSASTSNVKPVEYSRWQTVRPKTYLKHQDHQDVRYSKSARREHRAKTDFRDIMNLPRKWEFTELGLTYQKEFSYSAKAGLCFSVMSYNVLSQMLLEDHIYLYRNCPPEYLDWTERSLKLLSEIEFYKPDIICFQEVQFDHYKSFFKHNLKKFGYSSEYLKRSGDKADGCATFYKKDKFSLIRATPIEYCKGGLLDRDNVALVLELLPNSKIYHGSVKKLGVANTHLLYNPRRGDVKLAQLMVLLSELDKLLYRESHDGRDSPSKAKYHPLILCGDLNSEPDSDILRFLKTGSFDYNGKMARLLSGQSSGHHGRDVHLKKHFFDTSYGITDHCQYIKSVFNRFGSELQDYTQEKCQDIKSESNMESRFKNSQSYMMPAGSTSDNPVCVDTGGENWDQELREPSEHNPSSSNTQPTPHPYLSQSSGKLWHKLNLISAYKHRIQRFGFKECEVTSQHHHVGCCVDYILYSGSGTRTRSDESVPKEGKLKLLTRLGLMSSREIEYMNGLPNYVQPSDHLSLLTNFLLR